MSKLTLHYFFRRIIYLALFSAALWQGYNLVHDFRNRPAKSSGAFFVDIQGNVDRPGRYKIAAGTTKFEILQVAGVRSTSDLTPFNLTDQIDTNQDLNVGTLEKSAAVKANIRLEFFFGDLTIISAEGRDRIPQEGMSIDEGDRVLTEEKAQAEFSVNTFSRIDMDNFSELTFDKIGLDNDGRNIIELFQKTGLCWYKAAYTDKDDRFKILTPLADISVGGKGADFTIDVRYSDIVINVIDGLVLVERPDGTDAINMIAGQSVTIFRDGRPFVVTKLSPEISSTEKFNQLVKTKADMVMKHMPFNFLFCSPPQVFILVSVQYERNTILLVQLPPQTSVSFFVQGFSTLQESFLYGGVVFTTTLVERIMNTRIQKYVVFDKEDIIRTASAIGGLKVLLDDKAASSLQMNRGLQTLKGEMIVDYLAPSVSGQKESEMRQVKLIKSLFEQLLSKNIIITSLLADQILTNIETNISGSETMSQYNNYMSRKNYDFKNFMLPVRQTKEENKIVFEPIFEESRELLFKE